MIAMAASVAKALFALIAVLGGASLAVPQSGSSSEDRLEALYSEAKSSENSGDFAAATANYEEMLKIAPRFGPVYNNLGALYFKQRRYHEAAEILEKGLKIDPKMTSASALLGISLYQMGEYRRARTSLEAVVSTNPADNNAEFLLVQDLTKLGDFEAAAGHLEKLAKREPQNQQVWYLLGRTYMQLSEQALGKVNQIDPDSVWAHEISAELMESMKNYDGAIVEWKKAVEAGPRQPGVHFKLGDLYWSLSQWDNATEQFQQEFTIDPGNCMVQFKLGDILVRKSVEPEEALSKIDKALVTCPNLNEARADRGRLLLSLHREREAAAELEAVEKVDPSDPSPHFLLAQAYRALGRSQDAQAQMKSFSELESKSRAAAAERAQDVIRSSQSAH